MNLVVVSAPSSRRLEADERQPQEDVEARVVEGEDAADAEEELDREGVDGAGEARHEVQREQVVYSPTRYSNGWTLTESRSARPAHLPVVVLRT